MWREKKGKEKTAGDHGGDSVEVAHTIAAHAINWLNGVTGTVASIIKNLKGNEAAFDFCFRLTLKADAVICMGVTTFCNARTVGKKN